MNNQNATTPAAPVAPSTPSKDQAAVTQPAQAQTTGVTPAQSGTIPAAKG